MKRLAPGSPLTIPQRQAQPYHKNNAVQSDGQRINDERYREIADE